MAVNTLTTLVILSILIEFTIEIIKNSFPTIKDYKTQILSIILGIAVSITTTTGLLSALDIETTVPLIDYFLTGLIISRGSNVVHDLIKKLKTNTAT
ncbi:hypothetical protein PRVXH_001962 [Proteinivorax hydrogeniformans]|uniref:Holin n=1 Tax=Proteinivorax hydrogeniformans TaxID=1826727 RepID=A0AAU8HR42_9FIRM